MKQLSIFFAQMMVFAPLAFGQRMSIDVLPGFINYGGDLQPRKVTLVEARPAFQAGLSYSLNDHFYLRAGYLAGTVHADDKQSSLAYAPTRNLDFTSIIKEGNLCVEYDFFNIHGEKKWTPYVFGGVGFFHFDPYTFDTLGHKVYLRPLSTEGEGLPEYPGRKPYSLYQFNLMGGFGAKVALGSQVSIGFELCLRKLFTDYLDDVSASYVDKNVLLAQRGPEAVELAFRADELNPGLAYPKAGTPRGDPRANDTYYTGLLRLTYYFEGAGDGFSLQNKKSMHCPKYVL